MEERPTYYAIIPANVRYDNNLKLGEKMMYGEITALSNKTGICNASNKYFADLYNVSPQAISKWVKSLEKHGYIIISYEKEGKLITERKIKMVLTETDRVSTEVDRGINCGLGGYQQEIKENNTSINNKENINISKDIFIKEDEKKFKKPTIEQIQEYCNERKNNVDPERFFYFYESKGWVVGKNKMKNWKAAVISWEKNNNKYTKQSIRESTKDFLERNRKKILEEMANEQNRGE